MPTCTNFVDTKLHSRGDRANAIAALTRTTDTVHCLTLAIVMHLCNQNTMLRSSATQNVAREPRINLLAPWQACTKGYACCRLTIAGTYHALACLLCTSVLICWYAQKGLHRCHRANSLLMMQLYCPLMHLEPLAIRIHWQAHELHAVLLH